MKNKDLIKQLKAAGFCFLRHGGEHDVYTNGNVCIAVPKSREINEITAKEILKKAHSQEVSK